MGLFYFKDGCYWESMVVNNLGNKDSIVAATLRVVENILSIQKKAIVCLMYYESLVA